MNYETHIGDQAPARRAACYFLLKTVIDDCLPKRAEIVEFSTGLVGLSETAKRHLYHAWSEELGSIIGKDCRPWLQAQALGIADDYIDALRERIKAIEYG